MATLRCAYCPAKGRRSFARERGDAIPTCARHELNALHTIELDKDVLVDIAELNPDAQTGIMVALAIPDSLAQSAAIPDGVPPEQMHVTLAYLGDTADVSVTAEDIVSAISPAVAACGALELDIMGTARFAPEPPEPDDTDEPAETVDGEYPFVLLVSPSPELCMLQCAVTDALTAAGIDVATDYDYIPHITLDYIALEDEDPARVAHPVSFEVDTVCVWVAADCTDIPLAGEADAGEAEPDAEMSKALYGIDTAVAKADAEMRYTLAPVYLPDTEDAHGEFVDAPTLQKAFWGYLENSREIHLQHTDTPAGTLVECVTWPAEFNTTLTIPGEDPKPITFPAGTVYAGIIWDESSWALIKAGKLRGLSMGGRAKKVYADFDEA